MNQWGVIWSVRDSFIAGLFATLELFITAALAALIIGIFVIVKHKDNIKRLMRGEEKKITAKKKTNA